MHIGETDAYKDYVAICSAFVKVLYKAIFLRIIISRVVWGDTNTK